MAACSEGGSAPDPADANDLRSQIAELYESAREAGEDVPSDALEWAKGDLERIGDWEYDVLDVPAENDEAALALLNEQGADRWEAFWVERRGEGLRFFLKRPARSYLRMVPLQQLGRLVPLGDGQ